MYRLFRFFKVYEIGEKRKSSLFGKEGIELILYFLKKRARFNWISSPKSRSILSMKTWIVICGEIHANSLEQCVGISE